MTLIDKVIENNPEDVGDEFFGGVKYCPVEYDYLNVKDGCNCPVYETNETMSCIDCWNREYKEAPND